MGLDKRLVFEYDDEGISLYISYEGKSILYKSWKIIGAMIHNNLFTEKPFLDRRVEQFADYVYATFDEDRKQGRMKSFGDYYYPAMVSVCTDVKFRFLSEGYSDSPDAVEYGKTSMLSTMETDFYKGKSIKNAGSFKEASMCAHPLGQCAEQHAANDLLQQKGASYLDVKTDIFFSKAVRPVSGKEYDPCPNCKKLFNL